MVQLFKSDLFFYQDYKKQAFKFTRDQLEFIFNLFADYMPSVHTLMMSSYNHSHFCDCGQVVTKYHLLLLDHLPEKLVTLIHMKLGCHEVDNVIVLHHCMYCKQWTVDCIYLKGDSTSAFSML